MERHFADGGDRARDNGAHAARNQCVACCLDNGITIVTGIVFWIITIHNDARQATAADERIAFDYDDGVGDAHACQFIAVCERRGTDPCDGIGCTVIGD